jgi:heme-degrading monooxygenase HmoA
MIAVLHVSKFKGLSWVFGLFSMPIFHIYYIFNKNKTPFFKLMGTGRNGTFDLVPDIYKWAIMSTWDDENSFQNFKNNSFVHRYLNFFAEKQSSIFLIPIKVHGLWDGTQPFSVMENEVNLGAIAVLTRATIRPMKAVSFWKNVPAVSDVLKHTDGLRFSLGIGEVPILKQATISFWDSEAQMKTFAYKQNPHKNVIDKTRTEKWYSEELFARFSLLKIEGDLY